MKGLKLPISKRIEVIVLLRFGRIPSTELDTLTALINYSTNNTLALGIDTASHIKKETAISNSSFSTSLFRLEKRGIINRAGKTILIHPIFAEINSLDRLIVSFETPKNLDSSGL